MSIELGKKTSLKRLRHLRVEQVPYPNPREGTKGNFESAGPVDTPLERILLPPVLELPEDVLPEFLASRNHVGLSQKDKMLVAVDLPDKLVVADSRSVEIRKAAKVIFRSLGSLQRVAPPGHLRAVFDQLVENGDPALEDFLCRPDNLLGVLGIADGLSNHLRIGQQWQRFIRRQSQVWGREREKGVCSLLPQTKFDFARRAH